MNVGRIGTRHSSISALFAARSTTNRNNPQDTNGAPRGAIGGADRAADSRIRSSEQAAGSRSGNESTRLGGACQVAPAFCVTPRVKGFRLPTISSLPLLTQLFRHFAWSLRVYACRSAPLTTLAGPANIGPAEVRCPSERRTEAVHQLPKLRTRVRFPSLALDVWAGQTPI